MRILGSIVEPMPSLLAFSISDDLHRRVVGLKLVCHNDLRTAKSFHRFAQKSQCSITIPPLSDENLKYFALVIDPRQR